MDKKREISPIDVIISAFVLISAGGYYAFRKDTYIIKVLGKVDKSECVPYRNYRCKLQIKYTVDNKEYVLNSETYPVEPTVVGTNMDVYVNIDNHADAIIVKQDYKKLGFIVFGTGIAIIIGTILYEYFSFKGYI